MARTDESKFHDKSHTNLESVSTEINCWPDAKFHMITSLQSPVSIHANLKIYSSLSVKKI